MSHKQKIRSYLSKIIPQHNIGDQDNIFQLGFVNSMFAMEMVLFIEKNFGIKIENADLNLENFSTIQAIDQLIDHKLAIKVN